MSVVLVTGSNSGFGREAVLGFLREGHTVIASMRNIANRDQLVRLATAENLPEPDVVRLDVTDDESRRLAVEQILASHGGVDVLVNNAGVSYFGSLEDTPEADYRHVYETNVFGPVELTKLVLPSMRAAGSGRIVNITAIGAVLCNAYRSPYVGAKHALDAITASLDLEIIPFGLRAVSVLPAAFSTNIRQNAVATAPSSPYEETAVRLLEGLTERINRSSTPLSVFVDTLLAAATVPDPDPRYLVGGPIIDELRPAVREMNQLHDAEMSRLGMR